MVIKKLMLQSVIFNRSKFKRKSEVRLWLKQQEIKPLKKGCKAIETTQNTFIVKVRDLYRFNKRSLKTQSKGKFVKETKGRLK